MVEVKTVRILKAGDDAGGSHGIILSITEKVPEMWDKSIAECGAFWKRQARVLEGALYRNLPGATYAALLEVMEERRGRTFAVRG